MTADLSRLAPLLPALDQLLEAHDARTKQRQLHPLERRVRRALAVMWAEQARLLLALLDGQAWRFPRVVGESIRLSEAGPIPDPELDRAWAAVTATTAGAAAAVLSDTAPQALGRGYRAATRDVGMGLSFDLQHPRAVGYLQGLGAARVTAIDQTTRSQLQTLLARAGEGGWSYSRTAREINGKFAGFADGSALGHIRDRAELVAVTEMGQAYEHGQRMVLAELADEGVATEKAWDSVGDDRTCPDCDTGADAGWIPGGDQFPNGFAGPLPHPGCRCALLTRVAERSRVFPGLAVVDDDAA